MESNTSKLLIRSESVMQLARDATTLIALHHQEVEDQKLKLVPDYNRYMQLEEQGMFHGFSVRDASVAGNKLVGYATYVTTPLLHHLSVVAAVCDTIYILPSYRGRWTGVKLLKFAERVLKNRGVSHITMNVKKEHDFGSMLQRIGYKHTEVIYSKHLGD